MRHSPSTISPGQAAVLEQVKRLGPATADSVAGRLGVTGMDIRQPLEQLEKGGLVQHETRAGGRGRPSKIWRATEKAESCFANAHAALAVELIAHVRTSFGDEGLNRLIELRTAEQERNYRSGINQKTSVEARLKHLARLRSREGYMAEVRRVDANTWLLLEHHCPICSAARACTRICGEELNLFQRVLGDGVNVKRVSHILEGASRCAYRVTMV